MCAAGVYRKAEEARKKLRELQTMISQLHNLVSPFATAMHVHVCILHIAILHHFQSPDDSEAEEEHISPPERFHWRDDSVRDPVGGASSEGEESDDEEEEEEAGTETVNTTLTEGRYTGERVVGIV